MEKVARILNSCSLPPSRESVLVRVAFLRGWIRRGAGALLRS